ncbi:MAG: calcium-translocating P-type ATPase, PMCA-type [Candidatus Izimaplasma sp.]|nr:calcium-translocating P-type ATPase, PMCA-type [Candidatus Izimaplasma bacterium]
MKAYMKSTKEVLKQLKVDPSHGLTKEMLEANKATYGENTLIEEQKESLLRMVLGELSNFLNLLLIAAAIVSIVASGHLTDGLFIIAIVILNTGLSVFQERKANNAVEALKSMSAPKAKVLRDGKTVEVASTELTVGDIVLVEAGDYIPADIRFLETTNLKIDESALTGESVSVGKDDTFVSEEEIGIGDRENMGYMSTIVTYGRAKGIITSIGMETEIGKIATMLNEVDDEMTPLQKKIDRLGKLLGTVSIVVVVIIFLVGFIYNAIGFREFGILELFMVSVTLAVAAIPEGLPTVITVVLSLGMRKMAKKNAIVKELNAVETLGSTTVISSDKTGTLTQNKMVVTRLFDNENLYEVTGNGYEFEGEIKGESDALNKLIEIGGLCNDASIEEDNLIGDPTELALVTLLGKSGQNPTELRQKHKRIDEYPFDSDRKRMSTLHQVDKRQLLYTKGAPDELLNVCSHYLYKGEVKPIDKKYKDVIKLANQGMARDALRVLGFAYKEVDTYNDIEAEESNLIFVGLVGIIDPPREEVKDAIKICHRAGIRVVMITGDHKITASAIGKELGIIEDEKYAIDGTELNHLSDDELVEKVKVTNVFARVSPHHKVRIVKALQQAGEISSMTGDGVNDAPALKQANIGVAMGITGTDVSKEAADMVLMDDNFTTIVDAVKEGRVIYTNIRKFVGYLVSCNVGEVLLIFVAMLIGWGSPLMPIQILWINLVTDSFPAFALGLEKEEPGIMEREPIDPEASIIDKMMGIAIGFQAVFLTIAVLTSYYIGHEIIGGHQYMGQTFAFITIITGELFRAYSARSESITIFKMNPFDNKYVNYSSLFGFGLLIIVLFVPGINDLFKTNVSLQFSHLLIAFGLGALPLFGGEMAKFFKV